MYLTSADLVFFIESVLKYSYILKKKSEKCEVLKNYT